jgi:hypothetical protein
MRFLVDYESWFKEKSGTSPVKEQNDHYDLVI